MVEVAHLGVQVQTPARRSTVMRSMLMPNQARARISPFVVFLDKLMKYW
jgi:hypothetical protein